MKFLRTSQGVMCAALLLYALGSAYAGGLERAPGVYHILAREGVIQLKNYRLTSKGCNIGVNNCGGSTVCPDFMADNTQLVADVCIQTTGDTYENFCNTGSGCGPRQLPVQSWTCPILADETDLTFFAACDTLTGGDYPVNFTVGATDVTIPPGGGDCNPLGVDSDPGNGKCDLPAGDYGFVNPKKDSTISFDGGIYNMLAYQNGRGVTMELKSATTLNVSDHSDLTFANKARVLAECGDFRVNYEGKDVNMGKETEFTGDLCSPFAEIALGRHNTLTGHFFAKTLRSDLDNQGRCCLGNCGCFDTFTPNPVCEEASLEIVGGCKLNNIGRITICGVEAPVVSRSAEKIEVTVPAVGAPQSCDVVGESATGLFTANHQLQVLLCD